MVPAQHPARAALDKIVGVLLSRYKPDKIILFGSAAHGEFGPDSDLDVFVLLRESPINPLDRVVKIRSDLWPLKLGVPLDLFVLTRAELQRRLDVDDQFVQDILQNGTVLHGE